MHPSKTPKNGTAKKKKVTHKKLRCLAGFGQAAYDAHGGSTPKARKARKARRAPYGVPRRELDRIAYARFRPAAGHQCTETYMASALPREGKHGSAHFRDFFLFFDSLIL